MINSLTTTTVLWTSLNPQAPISSFPAGDHNIEHSLEKVVEDKNISIICILLGGGGEIWGWCTIKKVEVCYVGGAEWWAGGGVVVVVILCCNVVVWF